MRRPVSGAKSKSKPLAKPVAKAKPKPRSNVVQFRDFKEPSSAAKRWLLSLAAAVGVLILFIGVAVYSPLLAVEKIRITGTKLVSKQQILKVLKPELGKPLPQIAAADVAELLKQFKLIQSVSVISSPPHTLTVRVVERMPIAIVSQGGTYYFYDPAGVQIAPASRFDQLPVVAISGKPATSASYAAAVSVILALPVDLLPKISSVSARSIDNVTFQLRGYAGQRVIWGDKSNAVLKSKVLAALIKNQKATDRVTYDVSSPSAPTVRY